MAKTAGRGKGKKQVESDGVRETLAAALTPHAGKPSALLDTRVVYCGGNNNGY